MTWLLEVFGVTKSQEPKSREMIRTPKPGGYAVLLQKEAGTGGGNRDRTCDLLNANQMLSQLSYAPTRGQTVMI